MEYLHSPYLLLQIPLLLQGMFVKKIIKKDFTQVEKANNNENKSTEKYKFKIKKISRQ